MFSRILLVIGLLLILSAVCFSSVLAGDNPPEFYPEMGKNITVSGKVAKVKMTNFPNNPWQETIITADSGEQFVLIGEKVKELNDIKETESATISGILKAKMMVKGTLIKTIQITKIEKVEVENKTEN